jgi:uncharacterized protein YbbK (DUF523 family)
MELVIREKIKMGISACNIGARIRYNHKGWYRLSNLGRERDDFIWTPICPEVLAGLGVSRSPIRLVGGNGDDFWKGKAKVVDRQGNDLSEKIKKACKAAIKILKDVGVEGFVFMEGSPTSGVYRTTLKGKRLGKPPGTFGSLLLKEDWFLIPALDLDSPIKWWDWRRRLHAFIWLKRKKINTKNDLYEIWHNFKFLCQEVDRKAADKIGEELAGLPKNTSQGQINKLKRRILFLIRQPSTLNKIYSYMQKHYAFYAKSLNKPKQFPLDLKMSKKDMVSILRKMEQIAYEKKIEFGGAPVLYRSKR